MVFNSSKIRNRFLRWLVTANYPSYIIFFVTGRCNAKCKMCFYQDNMVDHRWLNELTLEEYEKIIVGQEIWTNDGHIIGLGLKERIADFKDTRETIRLIHKQEGSKGA